MKPKKQFIFICIFFSFFQCKAELQFADLPIGGNIIAVDSLGKDVDLKKLAEPVLLVFFGYTFCPDFCPNTLSKIKLATSQFSKEQKSKFKVVFISIDPKNDSSETATKYVNFYVENGIGYSFSEETLQKILNQYAAYREKTKSGFDHSTYIYVLDKNRKTKKLIKSTDSNEVIAESILRLSSDPI
ncbi:MAG: SCO family protein [Leptospira sp.]|nr:SCO family protein [Leptospira sp.]